MIDFNNDFKFAVVNHEDTGNTDLFVFNDDGGACLEMDNNLLIALIDILTRYVQ